MVKPLNVQFKENIRNHQSLAQEMVAFANTKGGKILIGVNDKDWSITGLEMADIQRLTLMIATVANEHIKSPIFVETTIVDVEGKKVMVVEIPEGNHKPYKDKDGLMFLKNGADKRKVTSNEEMARLLQSGGSLYADETLIHNSSYTDIDIYRFEEFYTEKYKVPFEKEKIVEYIENIGLGKEGKLNLAGALLFTGKYTKNIPNHYISAVWFKGNHIWENEYWSSDNLTGTMTQQYEKAYAFLINAMTKLQAGQNFNSKGKSEIPEVVFQEILVNALIHRNYFIYDNIKVFIFQDRVEIKSPGVLPNNLTEEKIKRGIRKKRNPLLDSFASDVLPYRALGSGILRALQAYPDIDFLNDKEAEEFKVTIQRPKLTTL